MSRPEVSLIIPTFNEGVDVIATIDCLLRHSGGIKQQLIVVDDGSNDMSVAQLNQLARIGKIELVRGQNLGATGARNRGAEIAQADIIGFIDAHCYTPNGWLLPLIETFNAQQDVAALSPVISCTKNLQAKGYGATWKDDELALSWLSEVKHISEVPFIGGAATFVRKSIFNKLSGFDRGIIRWGYEDIEFCIRLWLFGHKIVVVPESIIYHKFRKNFRYDINYRDSIYNKIRLIYLHFDGARLQRLLHHHLRYAGAKESFERLNYDGTALLRKKLKLNRVNSMDAFCDRFKLVC